MSTKNQFNPDYLCNDPSCKSREVTMEISREYQDRYEEMEREHKAEIERLEKSVAYYKKYFKQFNMECP